MSDGSNPALMFQPRAFAAKAREQTGTNFDGVAAIGERYIDGAHRPRIEIGGALSKVFACRQLMRVMFAGCQCSCQWSCREFPRSRIHAEDFQHKDAKVRRR